MNQTKLKVNKKTKYLPIIGLEIHVELKTKSKMFCGCSADYFGHEPNSQCCPICLGLPGALPFPNKKAIRDCLVIGLALDCQVVETSQFDRKNYFYPDLAKGFQISQYANPFCLNGKLGEIRIRRVHMEEDTGKLLHAQEGTLIDFNRSGVPLVEIVTEPDLHTASEAKIFLQKLQQIIRYLGVSDADMEKGSMRLEPNISLIKTNTTNKYQLPSYKVEVKNINSFKFVEKAINFEIERQQALLEKGEVIHQETRRFDADKGLTLPQRSKEEAKDYRYFPEPDIPPIKWTKEEINNLKNKIPELPETKLKRFIKEYGLSEYDATILTVSLAVADYFEESIKYLVSSIESKEITPKIIANWLINKKVDIDKNSPEDLVEMIAQKSQQATISDEELEKATLKVLLDNPKAVSDYKAGKEQALMFLVGQVLKMVKGQASGEEIKTLIKEELIK
ncbi:MAG: Asp-tRNA(Asn)/Glu-tRNA(Gln) amidotransferase subunit GatB [Patescibacteria group bacterium]|nr:Asp-tRNA(Asn)/Glu-tRNA(Gln) amidotransferase subunit GatB [Patescibacteria group bacterium]MCL5095331.1 Asp-tRNA(Asn)/Glu-tRNA(Gln) amidotransferase subunit GatB [Patescibacteria group bacterium]